MAFHKSQLQAIRHLKGPMMVLAGPGSGKTTVITHRVRCLVEGYGVDPGSILVITFTKAAASEMRQRFQKLMEGRSLPVSFGTFHAVFSVFSNMHTAMMPPTLSGRSSGFS